MWIESHLKVRPYCRPPSVLVNCTKQQFWANAIETAGKCHSDWTFCSFQHAIKCNLAINFQSRSQCTACEHVLLGVYKFQIIFACCCCPWDQHPKMIESFDWLRSIEYFICYNLNVILHFISQANAKIHWLWKYATEKLQRIEIRSKISVKCL